MVVENASSDKIKVVFHTLSELTSAEQTAVRELSANVYPPEFFVDWEGKSIEWSPGQWCAICWSPEAEALSYAGAIIRSGMSNGANTKIGGIGGVKTHTNARRQGLVSKTLKRVLDFFKEEEVDYGLLVCEPKLVPLYERYGWRPFEGELIVTQRGEKSKFTFNLPMVYPVAAPVPTGGVIDLMGPPW